LQVSAEDWASDSFSYEVPHRSGARKEVDEPVSTLSLLEYEIAE